MAEVSILSGLPDPGLRHRIQHLLVHRLQPSSLSTIQTAWTRHWSPFCDSHNLPYYVCSGSASRAGIMAAFVLHMVSKNSLRYSTIAGYVWAVVDKHISSGFASPLANVRDWAPFMHGVEVEIHEPAEPRLMLPWLLFIRAIPKADLSKPHEVAWLLVALFLFFLISRPELLPSAQGNFSVDKHLARRDVRWVKGYLEVCMQKIKQDPLCKRNACVAGKAWRAIGNGVGVFNTLGFLQLYLSMVQFDSDTSPLSCDERGNPLTYAAANRGLRTLLARVNGVTSEVAGRYSRVSPLRNRVLEIQCWI